jgi:hypothetical protein
VKIIRGSIEQMLEFVRCAGPSAALCGPLIIDLVESLSMFIQTESIPHRSRGFVLFARHFPLQSERRGGLKVKFPSRNVARELCWRLMKQDGSSNYFSIEALI